MSIIHTVANGRGSASPGAANARHLNHTADRPQRQSNHPLRETKGHHMQEEKEKQDVWVWKSPGPKPVIPICRAKFLGDCNAISGALEIQSIRHYEQYDYAAVDLDYWSHHAIEDRRLAAMDNTDMVFSFGCTNLFTMVVYKSKYNSWTSRDRRRSVDWRPI